MHLVMRNQNPLKVNGWLATLLLIAVTIVSSAVTAANGEQFCTHGGQNPVKGDTVACYSGPRLQSEQRAVCSRPRQDCGHCHVVCRFDHSDQKSGRLMPQTLVAKPKRFQVEERCGVRPSDCKVSVSAAVIAAFATCVLSFAPGVLAQPDSLAISRQSGVR